MDFQEDKIKDVSDKAHEALAIKISGVPKEERADRIEKVLEKRDVVLGKVKKIQEETGTPTEDEITGEFLQESGLGVDVDEFKNKNSEEK